MSTVAKVIRPWFIICVVISLLHQLTDKALHIPLPLADSYLDPLLLMPVLLQLLLWERRLLFGKGPGFVFSDSYLLAILLAVSFITEYLFPIWNTGFTGDTLDVICYTFGTIVFRMVFNKPYVKTHK